MTNNDNRRARIVCSIRWYGIFLFLYALLVLILARVHPSGGERGYGELAITGWPHIFLADRSEAITRGTRTPMHTVLVQIGLLPLFLNLLAVMAFACLARILYNFEGRFDLKTLFVVVTCVGVILGVFASTRFDMLEPIHTEKTGTHFVFRCHVKPKTGQHWDDHAGKWRD